MVAAKTTHGRTATSSAPKRQAQRCARTLIVRIRLTDAASQLQEYLPAGMAARLDAAPEELKAPKHPSQVAFEALQAAAGRSSVPAPFGLGRRARAARARLGADGGAAAVALHGREIERLATRAETASQAPWRAAIAAARGGDARGVRRAASNAGDAQRPYTRRKGPPNAGGAQRPYTRHRQPNAGYAQRPYTRRKGPPNGGRAQRPCTWHREPNARGTQRPYTRRGGWGSGGGCAVGYAGGCAGRTAGG
jgi:hypothetical protein